MIVEGFIKEGALASPRKWHLCLVQSVNTLVSHFGERYPLSPSSILTSRPLTLRKTTPWL